MRKILMYFYNEDLPVLKEVEGHDIVFKDDLKKKNIDYLMGFYNKLGGDFNKRYEAIKAHEKENNKLPIFFEDISIRFKAE